ncbi:MAG: aldo/keto reductase [Pseudomonadota bacterium]|nr:aldo/keto reductase [Pseudomonadota bacterium]
MGISDREISRRRVIQAGAAAGVAMVAGRTLAAAASIITKAIPSTGEKIPVVGTGTNAYGVNGAEELAELKRVLTAMPGMGGMVIDTARAYGSSEEVIGKLLADIGNRDKFFLATKTPMNGDVSNGKAVLDESFRRLQVSRIDLMQIHNLHGMNELMPHFKEYKAAGKIRYIGMSTSTDNQYDGIAQAIRAHKPDFVQVDYSIGNRGAADSVLPLAQEQGLGVLINVPFGGRGRTLFPRVQNVAVPDWAKQELDIGSWAQFFLKYIVSQPAVTVAIPGTTTMAYLQDNQAAGRGRLPTAAQRKKMEEFWDGLPS